MSLLILPIPNDKAAQERYPPSCQVLWKNHNERIIPARVKSLSIHLLSKATLVFLEGHTDPVSVNQLHYAPSCPVWIEDQIKGTVVCSYQGDHQLKYYKIETMEGCKDIAEQKVSFRQTTPCETNSMDREAPVCTNKCQSEVSSNLTKSKPIVSPDRSTNINDDSSVRPLTNYLAIPQWISRSHLEAGKNLRICVTATSEDALNNAIARLKDRLLESVEHHEVERLRSDLAAQESPYGSMDIKVDSDDSSVRSLTKFLVIPQWISRSHLEDVIDNDTIREISYTMRGSSVYIPAGKNLRICDTATSEDSLKSVIERLKKILLESVEDDEVERLRSDLVRPDACLNSHNDRPTPDLLQKHDPFENKGIKKRTQQDCPRDAFRNGSPTQESYLETPRHVPAKKKAKLESPTSILSRKCADDALTRVVHVPSWAGNWGEIKNNFELVSPWLQANLSCRIDFEQTSNAIILKVKSTNVQKLDSAEEAVENLVLRNVSEFLRGRLLHHFAKQIVGMGDRDGEVKPLTQRNPDDLHMLVHGAVILLPKMCTKGDLYAGGWIQYASRKSGCKIRVVDCKSSNDPFVFVQGAENQVVEGCRIILKRMEESVGLLAPKPIVVSQPSVAKAKEVIAAEAPKESSAVRSMELEIPAWTGSLYRHLQDDHGKVHAWRFLGGTIEILDGESPVVVRVTTTEGRLEEAVREVEDWILRKIDSRFIPIAGYPPVYRSRLLHHWHTQRAKRNGCKDTTVVQGRRYGETGLVYMSVLPLNQNDRTETLFGVNGQALSLLRKQFECRISVELHKKTDNSFVYIEGYSKEKIATLTSYMVKELESKRKQRGVLC